MLLKLSLLFFTAFLCGSIAFLPLLKAKKFSTFTVVFSGGYLFAITLLHIFPDIFALHGHEIKIGMYILLGFFLQLFLDFFSKGIEHGHKPHIKDNINIYALLVALCIHAFFDGFILTDCNHHTHILDGYKSLFLGILLHKAPVSFVLVTFLLHSISNKKIILLILLLFAISSPIGLLCAQYAYNVSFFSPKYFTYLFALVGGSFLHITTTILFEFHASHHFNAKKLFISFLGALLAVILEYIL